MVLSKYLAKPPFEFLKVLVYEDRIELADDRYEKLVALLEQALADANPGQYKDALVGKYNWAMTTFAGELPEFLEALFQKYFVAYLLYLLTKVTCKCKPRAIQRSRRNKVPLGEKSL